MTDTTLSYLRQHRDESAAEIARGLAAYEHLTEQEVAAALSDLDRTQAAQALQGRLGRALQAAQGALRQAEAEGAPLPAWEDLVTLVAGNEE